MNPLRSASVLLLAGLAAPAFLAAQAPAAPAPAPRPAPAAYDPAPALAAQKEALAVLSALDGTWRGTAWTILPSGEKHTLTQTERVGPMLDGAVKVVEGRGYDAAGKLAFNALGTISFNPATKAYAMQSHAMGRSGSYVLRPTADGFVWEIPAGPMLIRYTATVKDGTWKEVGDRILPGQEPVRFFEMDLRRLGGTDWPAGGAVGPK